MCLAIAACTKASGGGAEFGEPVGIELSGANLMVAVAPEKGHEIPASAVPELASALAGVQRGCTIQDTAQVTATVKDGAIAAPQTPTMDAASACVAKAIDGKNVKSVPAGKILIQIAHGSAKAAQ